MNIIVKILLYNTIILHKHSETNIFYDAQGHGRRCRTKIRLSKSVVISYILAINYETELA